MSDWHSTTLQEIISTIESGSRPKGGVRIGDNSEGVPSYGGENISMNGGMLYDSVRMVPTNFATEMRRGVLSDKDVLINKDGANTGKSAIYRKPAGEEFATINEHLFLLRCNKGIAEQEFLYHFLNSEFGKSQIARVITGSAQPGLNSTFPEFVRIDLPPLPEQKKIAEILSGIDRLITQCRQSLEKLALLERATIKSTIDRIEKIDSNCRQLSAGEICTRIFVGIASSTTHAYTDNTGVPMLRNQNIRSGTIDGADLVYISREFAEEQKSKRLLQGDVITARTGYPGTSAVVGREFENCHSFTTLISRVETGIIIPEYYSLYLNSPQGKAQVAQLQAGGAQENLNVGALEKMIIPVPELETQIGIVKASEEFLRTFSAKESFIRKTERLKDSLSSDLLSGRKRVSV